MIFSKPLDRLVITGRKTETRRRAKHDHDGRLLPCRFRPGRDYAVQRGRGQAEIARIHILSVSPTPEPVGSIDFAAARREGFKTTVAFKDYWLGLHDHAWPPTEPCDACDGDGTTDCPDCWEDRPTGPYRAHPLDAHPCGRCDGTGEQLAAIDDHDVEQRFADHHADTLVWVIRFELTESIEYLTPAARPAGTELGITHNPAQAMRDEPDRVDPDLLARHWREDAAKRHQAARPRHKHPDDQLRARRARKAALTRDADTLRRLADELDETA